MFICERAPELVRRWTQHFTQMKLTRRNLKLNKFTFGTPWLRDLLSKHWFVSSVWISVAESQTFLHAKRPQRWRAWRNGCFRRLKSLFYARDLVTWWEIGRCMINCTKTPSTQMYRSEWMTHQRDRFKNVTTLALL